MIQLNININLLSKTIVHKSFKIYPKQDQTGVIAVL